MSHSVNYVKPNGLSYFIAKTVTTAAVKTMFKRKYLRNELKGVKGPYVVICNHECMLDGIFTFSINRNKHTLVMSKSMLDSLPIYSFVKKLGVIEKHQFQTKIADMKKLKAVVDSGHQLILYPAGLMTENGLSTPIPQATYKFLQWLGVDVYVARVYGTYFAMPKWAKGIRRGRTLLDVYKLFDSETLKGMKESEIKSQVDDAILFDAYEEQERLLVKYKKGNNVQGLQNVVYACPNCKSEFTIDVKGKREDTLCCRACGYEQTADKYGFLHAKNGREIRHVSVWDSEIYDSLRQKVRADNTYCFSAETLVRKVDISTHKFQTVGEGVLSLSMEGFRLDGRIYGEEKHLHIPTHTIPALPNSPGRHIELQDGDEIYRCSLKEGKFVQKFVHLIKIFYEMHNGVSVRTYPKHYSFREET
ncbi:MAG: 1-acyl-sn-glycerol-3-phosphate acyltransferase [Clostridia bacterium]|nr:1-acyl-sn-glycerol-3-phosphate acyltransferase [Clostridia bacterium]